MKVTNRLKGLDLIDRVPEELWKEVCNIVQEVVIKTVPKKKKRKKAKWLSEEDLQISCEKKRSKRQMKKGEIHLFECRVTKNRKRDKKAFLSDQGKEVEENDRMGKTMSSRKLDTNGTFLAKMGTIKDRSGMDLTEAEDIKKRWQ